MFVVISLCVAQASAIACTTFGGGPVWDDQNGHVWTVGQSGTSLYGTEANLYSCGTGSIDTSNSTIFSGSITMKVNYPTGCSLAYAWFYTSSWSSNCDQLTLTYYEYDWQYNQRSSGALTLITYPSDESSTTMSWTTFPAYHRWTATALSGGITDRHFANRFFYEENIPITPSDNCWWSGISDTYRYDSLCKNCVNPDGSTGPYPNQNTWQTSHYADAQLGSNVYASGPDAWNDKIGWGPWWTTYHRQNSPNLISNGVCTAQVQQRMQMIANWGGGLFTHRPYRDNTHTITIWWNVNLPNDDFGYWNGRNGSTNDWHIGSNRTNQASTTTFWPILDPPTNLQFVSVQSNAIALSWTATPGDWTRFAIWRSTDGANYAYYDWANLTAYTDNGVSSGNHYWYCVREQNTVGGGPLGTPDPTSGPCSNGIDTTTP